MLEIKSLADFDDELANNGYLDNDENGGFGSEATNLSKKLITKLASGVRDTSRVNVFLDGKFAFSLDIAAQVVDLQVKVGQKVDAKKT